MTILGILGTAKGGFLLRSDDRSDWRLEGPLFKGWKVTASTREPGGPWIVATASDVYGPALHLSDDLVTWRQLEDGPRWSEESCRRFRQFWTIHATPERWLVGIDDAGLFESRDRGESWRSVEALNEHPTREGWYPGAGGLCLHCILVDPANPDRIWCGISSVGVFRTEDGGLSWCEKNGAIPPMIEDDGHAEIGNCVHALVADPADANRMWRREHNGMFRSSDGGDTWERIEDGLGSWFGFPLVRDRRTGSLYDVPLESDEYRMPTDGALAVYRSRDDGDTWEGLRNGLPQEHAYMGVLRSALALDHRDPCGLVFGTTSGTIFVSSDAGESWRGLPWTLPRILSVELYDLAEEPV